MSRDAAYLLDMLLAAREAIEFAATVEDFSAFRDSRMAQLVDQPADEQTQSRCASGASNEENSSKVPRLHLPTGHLPRAPQKSARTLAVRDTAQTR